MRLGQFWSVDSHDVSASSVTSGFEGCVVNELSQRLAEVVCETAAGNPGWFASG